MNVSLDQERIPGPVVLQPDSSTGVLNYAFQQSLDEAMTSSSNVIVDLLWVDSIGLEETHLLAEVLLNFKRAGKTLTFLGLDHQAQVEIDRYLGQGSGREAKESYSLFAPEFEAFLDRHRDLRAAEALA